MAQLGRLRQKGPIERLLRHRSDITPIHRLVFEGRTLDIEAVLPDERKSRLVIMCTEQV